MFHSNLAFFTVILHFFFFIHILYFFTSRNDFFYSNLASFTYFSQCFFIPIFNCLHFALLFLLKFCNVILVKYFLFKSCGIFYLNLAMLVLLFFFHYIVHVSLVVPTACLLMIVHAMKSFLDTAQLACAARCIGYVLYVSAKANDHLR